MTDGQAFGLYGGVTRGKEARAGFAQSYAGGGR